MNYARVLAGSLLLAAGLVLQGCGSKPARQQKVAVVKQPVPAAPYKQSKNDGHPGGTRMYPVYLMPRPCRTMVLSRLRPMSCWAEVLSDTECA